MTKKKSEMSGKPTSAQQVRIDTKSEKLEYQLELNKMLGDENIEYLNNKYPEIRSTPRQNYNVNMASQREKMFEKGISNEEIISEKYGKRTKIEKNKKIFNLKKKNLKKLNVGKSD